MAPRSLQREEGALRVDASDDPAAVQQLMWAVVDPASAGLHAFDGRVDVVDIEVEKPERDRICRKFGGHAADRLRAYGEQLIRVCRSGFGIRFFPAKELAIKGKSALRIGEIGRASCRERV